MMSERERVGVAPGERVTVVRARNTPNVEHQHDHFAPGLARLADWRIHWGPVVAGLLSAITAMTLLSLLGAAVGLTAFDYGDAVAASRGVAPAGADDAARNAGVWAALSAIASFLIGGWVASRWAGLIDRGSGAWHGALVFMLAVPVLLWLAGQGLGSIVGGLGNFAGEYGRFYTPDQARAAADANLAAADVARAAEAAKRAAWGAFAGALFGLGAAALGGYFGVHRPASERHVHHEVRTAA